MVFKIKTKIDPRVSPTQFTEIHYQYLTSFSNITSNRYCSKSLKHLFYMQVQITVNEASNNIFIKLLNLKLLIKKSFPDSNVTILNIAESMKNDEVALTAKHVSEHFCSFIIDIIDNCNANKEKLSRLYHNN